MSSLLHFLITEFWIKYHYHHYHVYISKWRLGLRGSKQFPQLANCWIRFTLTFESQITALDPTACFLLVSHQMSKAWIQTCLATQWGVGVYSGSGGWHSGSPSRSSGISAVGLELRSMMLKYRQKPNRVQEKEKQDSGQLSVANSKAGRSDRLV